MTGFTVSLPYPISANKLWRAVGGRNIKSAEYRRWLTQALWACKGAQPVKGPYRLTILATRPDNRRRDLGNLEKAVSDALQEARLIDDDCAAQSIHLEWVIAAPIKGGAILATVEPVSSPPEAQALSLVAA